MAFTVFAYKNLAVVDQKSFASLAEAFAYLGKLDLQNDVERCILDNGQMILFDLKRKENGWLSS